MDWDAWARDMERALDMAERGGWKERFAPDASFEDPATPATRDVGRVASETRTIFPDWRQEITWIRGGDDWAVFEWVGTATYHAPDGGTADGAPVRMRGATIVELDGDGRITSWRDFLDRKEPEMQIRRHAKAASAGADT
jgi:ketosteroid isomerase-like protein